MGEEEEEEEGWPAGRDKMRQQLSTAPRCGVLGRRALPGAGPGFSRSDRVTAFLETRLLLVRADRAGGKMLPWHSQENHLTLKRCWDKPTVEGKQSLPGSVAAAASPAETRVTHAGCSGHSGPTGHAPEAAG